MCFFIYKLQEKNKREIKMAKKRRKKIKIEIFGWFLFCDSEEIYIISSVTQ